MILKAPQVKSHRFSRPDVVGTHFSTSLQCLECLVGALIFLLLHSCDIPPICDQFCQEFGSHVSLPLILFKMWPPLQLTIDGLLFQSSGHFQS